MTSVTLRNFTALIVAVAINSAFAQAEPSVRALKEERAMKLTNRLKPSSATDDGSGLRATTFVYSPPHITETPSLNEVSDDDVDVLGGNQYFLMDPDDMVRWRYTYTGGGPYYKVLSDDLADIEQLTIDGDRRGGAVSATVTVQLIDCEGARWPSTPLAYTGGWGVHGFTPWFFTSPPHLDGDDVLGNLENKVIIGFEITVENHGPGSIAFDSISFLWEAWDIEAANWDPVTTCPPGATIHPGGCGVGNDGDDGCLSEGAPEYYSIAPNEIVCSELFADSSLGVRDTDWYQFDIIEQSDVTVSLICDAPEGYELWILPLDPSCEPQLALAYAATAVCCTEINATAYDLDPGEYCFVVAPLGGENGSLDCPNTAHYNVSFFTDCSPYLPGNIDGDGSVTFNDLNLVLGNWGNTCGQ